MTKRCFKCLCEKPLAEFYAHSRMRDGRLNKCKDCTKKDVATHRVENLERVRSYDRARASMPHRVAARTEYAKTEAARASHKRALLKAMLTNKTARKARQEVANAIRGGRLEPQPCFCCGKRAQAHHPDYSAPLAVVWLCTTHHAEAHKQTRQVLREQLCEA